MTLIVTDCYEYKPWRIDKREKGGEKQCLWDKYFSFSRINNNKCELLYTIIYNNKHILLYFMTFLLLWSQIDWQDILNKDKSNVWLIHPINHLTNNNNNHLCWNVEDVVEKNYSCKAMYKQGNTR